nr:serine/threonine-protein kinase [Streptomonospora litoralis]
MGTVYGALGDGGACIAVKVVHERYAEDSAFREAFAREVELMRRIEGIYAVAVHAADTDAARPWLATDFVPGTTLRRHVETVGPLEPDMLFAFAAGTAEALTAIHAAGVVHCDVKPGNVMLTPTGPRILDFGIARPVSRSAAEHSGGRVFGSPGWVSPERYRGAEAAPPADVFAWACMVAYAATGRPPYGRGDAVELRHRVLETAPDVQGVPGELRPMIESALAADPDSRPTAESAYRGLIDFSTAEDTSRIQTRDLGDRLRGLVAGSWRGIDVSWHNPALWIAAAPVVGAAGAMTAAMGAGGAGGAAAGAGTGGAAAAGGAGAAGAGVGGAATAAGVTGGVKVAVLSASAVLVAGAIGTGAYLAAGSLADSAATSEPSPSASPSPSPTLGTPDEIVAGIVDGLEAADSYRAVQERTPNDGLPSYDEYVRATVGGEPFFHSVAVTGSLDSPEYATDRIYRPDQERLIERAWNGSDADASYTAASGPMDESIRLMHTREAVLHPFQNLADSMEVSERTATDLEGTPAVRITGAFDLVYPGRSVPVASGVDFGLWTAMDGLPLRLEYEFVSEDNPLAGASHTWTYSGFGGLDRRLCGTVENVPRVGRALLVPTAGSIACDDARAAVEAYLAMPDEEKEGSGLLAEVDGWNCGLSTASEVLERTVEDAGVCYDGELGAEERVDLIRLD